MTIFSSIHSRMIMMPVLHLLTTILVQRKEVKFKMSAGNHTNRQRGTHHHSFNTNNQKLQKYKTGNSINFIITPCTHRMKDELFPFQTTFIVKIYSILSLFCFLAPVLVLVPVSFSFPFRFHRIRGTFHFIYSVH